MKTYQKNFICALLSFAMVMCNLQAVSALWDGSSDDDTNSNKIIELLDMNRFSDIMGTLAIPSRYYTKNNKMYSALWKQGVSKRFTVDSVPRDWSNYDIIEMWVYADGLNDNGAGFITRAVTVPSTTEGDSYVFSTTQVHNGWNYLKISISTMSTSRMPDITKCTYFQLTVDGWSMTPVPNANFYIASIKVMKADSLEKTYSSDKLDTAQQVMDNSVVAIGGDINVLNHGVQQAVDEKDLCQYIDGSVYAPVSFFDKYLGITNKKENEKLVFTRNGNTLSYDVKSGKASGDSEAVKLSTTKSDNNGELSFNVPELSRFLGYYTYCDGKYIILSSEDIIEKLATNEKVNEVLEIVEYRAAQKKIDTRSITEGDWKQLRSKWVYNLAGDENINLTDNDLILKVKNIDAYADSALNKFRYDVNADDLFSPTPITESGEMTGQYKNLWFMAVAYGTYGSKYYKNKEMLDKLMFGIDWMYNHRYGQAEIKNRGWRSTSTYNWWDWQIGSPRYLIDIMMIVYDELSDSDIINYLSLFDHLVPKPTMTGSNLLNQGLEVIGASILEKNAVRLVIARDGIDSTFNYCDNGANEGYGFYTDGSYVYHLHHAMNGTYGIEQIQYTGPMLSLLKGTKFEYTNPLLKNMADWIFEGQEPLIFDGVYMRGVLGRYPNNSRTTAITLAGAMLDAVDSLDSDDAARVKSFLKYLVQADTKTNYYSSLTLMEGVKLKQIMSDESVLLRKDYFVSKIYNNEDKAVHHTEDWGFGLSMSSSRIAGYESINDLNKTGWYHGDGLTQVFSKSYQYQYDNPYWSDVNSYRMPGVTADTQQRYAVSTSNSYDYLSSQDFVGGVTVDDKYSTAAMQLESFHNETGTDLPDTANQNTNQYKHKSSLMAKKAWFMFDDEVVCLGSDINANDGFRVETTIDNRRSSGLKSMADTSNNRSYEIVDVAADQTPEPDNIAQNTIDGDFNSRWSGQGDASITWDLGEVKNCGFIALSFMGGNTRQTIFQLETSEDGANWIQAFDGRSSGKTSGQEVFDLKNTNARYVRFVGHGNTSNTWNSITSAAIFPLNNDESMSVPEVKAIGTEKVSTDMSADENIEEIKKELTGIKWLTYNNNLGYYFPDGGNIFTQRTVGDCSYFELWFDHGENPRKQSYAYVILPEKDAQQTEGYAKNPDTVILSNTEKIQSVHDNSTDTTGTVYWNAGSFNGITVSTPLIVMVKDNDGEYKMSVSDPTHKLKNAVVTIDSLFNGVKSADSRVKVENKGNSTEITLDFENSDGSSIETVFTK